MYLGIGCTYVLLRTLNSSSLGTIFRRRGVSIQWMVHSKGTWLETGHLLFRRHDIGSIWRPVRRRHRCRV